MHKLREMVERSIDSLTARGITTGNVMMLGSLVDIMKDIEMAEYYKYQCSDKTDSVLCMLKDVKEAEGTDESTDSMVRILLSLSDDIRNTLSGATMTKEQVDHYNKLFK